VLFYELTKCFTYYFITSECFTEYIWRYKNNSLPLQPILNNKSIMRQKVNYLIVTLIAIMLACSVFAGNSNKKRVRAATHELDKWAEKCHEDSPNALGYPGNYSMNLTSFYEWYSRNDMATILINNAGDPFDEPGALSSARYEREVIEYFAPLYGFEPDNLWGIVTMSGSDGNNHGIYFGRNYLKKKTGKEPVVYVSDEAHYSNFRLCDLQHLEVRMIKSNEMGQMIPDSLEAQLVTDRPCLIVYAMGSTFKGAIDDMKAINEILARVQKSHPEMLYYRHVDAALFGGYLPFTDRRDLVNHKLMGFESIAVSGHKFFGIDSPCGIFITSRDIYENQVSFDVPYLNSNMRMINCSRSGIEPLKFWWLIQVIGTDGWGCQATLMMENTDYLMKRLKEINWPCWCAYGSNTVFFKRPSAEIVKKYCLANNYDERFGGELSHIVVMQHVSKETIDHFIADLQ